MGALYAKNGKIYNSEPLEIYIPMEYFNNEIAINRGSHIETFAILYCRTFKGNTPSEIKLWNIPVTIDIMVYESKLDTIKVGGKNIDVMTLQFMKDSYIMHQTLPKGREIAGTFLNTMLSGKLPKILNYNKVIDIWWKNLEISGISYKVPSKMYELVVANIYRNAHNEKERYGEFYGRNENSNGFDYTTGNVRSVVKNLSTFSGMVFEDIGAMISNGINNSINNVEEPISPLEKIIHY